ncbi:hypothetical protein [Corallococcus exiguus]|uniref:Uncharacterized protein n=1 Tax=Corallococcus exiguus TaxID=83462 RepID=A0A7X4YJ64_9BACT|nr:hypothetical protein [Corallococcus exiguus]NBC46368.1 hypothetical protein [Corallococcus exiguus]TNV49954.1 hypothetical protein FH620_39735 [Corallococcus exiguus]
MSRFVFWTGIYNAVLAASLLFPPMYRAIGLNIPAPIWGWLFSAFLAYTSLVLIYASKDLHRCAPLVYWEALLRYAAGLLLIAGGLFGNLGLTAAAVGTADLFIGLVYMFGLPHELEVSHSALLLDKVDPDGRAKAA